MFQCVKDTVATDIYKPTFRHYLIMCPAYLLIRLWYASLRLDIDEQTKSVASDPRRIIGLSWHNRIFFLGLSKLIFRKKLPMCALISASRDGAYLAALLSLMGVIPVRGSTKRRGAGAVVEMIEALKSKDLFITPDGPRGPKYKVKPGALKVAEKSGETVMILRIAPKRYYAFKSWDRFILPLPFTRVKFSAEFAGKYDDIIAAAKRENLSPEEYLNSLLSKNCQIF